MISQTFINITLKAPTLIIISGFMLVLETLNNSSFAQALDKNNKEYQQSINDIGNKIKSISNSLNNDQAQLKSERHQLFKAEKELASITENLANTEFELAKNEHENNALELQINKNVESQSENRNALSELLVQRYQKGRPNYLKSILNQENPYAVGRLANYHGYFTKAFKERNDKLIAFAQEAQELKKQQLIVIEELNQAKDKHQQQLEQQNKAKEKRKQTIASLDKQVSTKAKTLSKLNKDRERLQALLAQLKKQAEEFKRLELERQRKAEELAKQQENDASRKKPPSRVLVKGGFNKQKGRLSFPVNGELTRKFGKRLPESGMRSEGHFFNTKGSVEVKSIFRGRVLFADFLKGYGLLIIVDHGDDHISLYGHNDRLLKKVGDTVEVSETIAKTGQTGGLKSHGLYFEIRKNATPVDPAKWCR